MNVCLMLICVLVHLVCSVLQRPEEGVAFPDLWVVGIESGSPIKTSALQYEAAFSCSCSYVYVIWLFAFCVFFKCSSLYLRISFAELKIIQLAKLIREFLTCLLLEGCDYQWLPCYVRFYVGTVGTWDLLVLTLIQQVLPSCTWPISFESQQTTFHCIQTLLNSLLSFSSWCYQLSVVFHICEHLFITKLYLVLI